MFFPWNPTDLPKIKIVECWQCEQPVAADYYGNYECLLCQCNFHTYSDKRASFTKKNAKYVDHATVYMPSPA